MVRRPRIEPEAGSSERAGRRYRRPPARSQLAVIELGLLIRAVKIGPPETVELIDASEANSGKPLTFSY